MRHGRCADNASRRLPRPDAALDATGARQARCALGAISRSGLTPVLAVSSALRRARETTAIVADGLDIPVRIDPRFNEFDFGSAAGLTEADFAHWFPRHAERIKDPTDLSYVWPGGESRAAFVRRIVDATSDLAREPGPILIVTHWTVIGMLRALRSSGDIENWTGLGVEPAQVVRLAGPPGNQTPDNATAVHRERR